MDIHRNVVLVCDIMFINRIPFLISISENIAFTTVENIGDRTLKNVEKAIVNIKDYIRDADSKYQQ